ncbi:MAG: hypothetical protein KDA34_14755 [Phycisphaerales bacterium]|nr:hypothetical protein [Phycisphaerales bacterium]
MPLYARKCTSCMHTQETLIDLEDPIDQKLAVFDIVCELCGCVTSAHVPNENGGVPSVDRKFAGRKSELVMDGCHPSEVSEARQLFAGTGLKIEDDGTYKVRSRSDYRNYQRRDLQMRKDAAEKQAAHDASVAARGDEN